MTSPPTIRAVSGSSRMIESMQADLPEPDSPTIPNSFPGATEKLTPSTARTSPTSVKNEVRSDLTSSSGFTWVQRIRSSRVGGIEAVAEVVAEEVEGHHREEDEDAGNQDPWIAREVLHVLRLRQKVAPACGRLLDAETQQRQRAFAEDEAGD